MNRSGWTVLAAMLTTASYVIAQAPAATSKPAAPASQAGEASAAAVKAAVTQLIEAFNAGDAAQVAPLFAADAEFEDEAGQIHTGREAIAALATAFAERFPGAKMEAEIEALRFVAPQLALVEAIRTTTTADGLERAETRASLTLLEQDGKWLVAAIREIPAEIEMSPHEHLEPLAWLVGEWVDEGPDASIDIVCRWSDDQNFLLIEYATKIAGETTLKTTQRLGWDPLKQQVRSWMFDSDGGYGDGEWSRAGKIWTVKSAAVLPDGTVGSATFTIEPDSADRFQMTASHRVIGDTTEPDREVTVVRKPPASKRAQ
ncbi:MAG: SgcJ/EcaC family oxidoreductase [Planctomycetaceae bacterium]|nr:SgcJ/EcaC family oxidoreductase [Planctomycetaceae bacterium]